MAYTKLDRIAWRHGYALALHGSMARDLDLIAIPWTDDADDPEKMIDAFHKFIMSKANIDIKGKYHATKKPHGRMAYSMSIGYDGHYLDISIMPRLLISSEEAIQLFQNEITWCLDHPDPMLNKDQQIGFMNGIRQAQYLLKYAEHHVQADLRHAVDDASVPVKPDNSKSSANP